MATLGNSSSKPYAFYRISYAIPLIDRQLHEVVLSVGTDNPGKVVNSYIW